MDSIADNMLWLNSSDALPRDNRTCGVTAKGKGDNLECGQGGGRARVSSARAAAGKSDSTVYEEIGVSGAG